MGIVWPSPASPHNLKRSSSVVHSHKARKILRQLKDLRKSYRQCFKTQYLLDTQATFELLHAFRNVLSEFEETIDPRIRKLLSRTDVTQACKDFVLTEVQAFRFTIQYNEQRVRESLNPEEIARFDLENPVAILGL